MANIDEEYEIFDPDEPSHDSLRREVSYDSGRAPYGSAAQESYDDRTEVVRVQTSDEEEEPTHAAPRHGSSRVDGGRDTRMVPDGAEDSVRRMRLPAFVGKFISGSILDSTAVKENYRYVVCIMALLLLSIAMLFTSLGVYMRYTKLVEEVQLLRERAIRTAEQRYEVSSHSAVVRSLKERGINLQDPSAPREIIE